METPAGGTAGEIGGCQAAKSAGGPAGAEKREPADSPAGGGNPAGQ